MQETKCDVLCKKGFRAFPSEVRILIFKNAPLNWVRGSPALLVALRGDNELYHEALEIYYKTSTFILSSRNIWAFKAMPLHIIKATKNLGVEINIE